ncbi:hypothetical protein [Xanthobacter sediminis]
MKADASYVNRPALTDAEKLEKLHDLEGAVNDLENMAGTLWDLLEAMFDGSRNERLTGGRKDLYSLEPGQVQRFHFAVGHAWTMAQEFRENFEKGLGYRSS